MRTLGRARQGQQVHTVFTPVLSQATATCAPCVFYCFALLVCRPAPSRLGLSRAAAAPTDCASRTRAGFASAAGALRARRAALGGPLRAAGLANPAGLASGALPRGAAPAARGYAASGLPPHTELGMPALSPTMSQARSLPRPHGMSLLCWMH